MEELTAIKTADGREFKPWASKETVQEVVQQAVQDPASITAITSEIAGGKAAIAAAINAKGGSARATESFSELAQAVEEIPNFSDMVKLAGIIAGGNYDKNALQGHNENVKYGKAEIIDNVGAFETFSTSYTFQYWDVIKKIELPYWRTQKTTQTLRTFSYAGDRKTTLVTLGLEEFPTNSQAFYYSRIAKLYMPNVRKFITGYYDFYDCNNLLELEFGTLTQMSPINYSVAKIRNIKIGIDTNIDLLFQYWTATAVIAEGQSGIDELNSNLYNNLLTKLYDHSQDGETRTLRIGWLSNVTAENISYANAKGWTLTT